MVKNANGGGRQGVEGGGETREIAVAVDAEFITELGDGLRRRDETLTEFVAESCRDRLRQAD